MLYRLFALLLQQAEAVWRTVVKTGTGLIVANDTTEGQPVDIQVQGWTKQEAYDGKNTIPDKFSFWESGDYNGATGEKIESQYRIRTKEFCPVNFTNAFTILDNDEIQILGRGYSEDGAFVANLGEFINNETKNIPTTVKKIGFVLGGKTENIDISKWEEIFNTGLEIMVSDNSLGTSYEPYTGNQPSPSPEYPQEIINSGKDNSETGKYEVVLEVNKNNIFPFCKDFSQWRKFPKDSYFGENEYSDYSVKTLAIIAYASLRSPVFNLKPNTKYTISGYIYTDKTDNISKSYGIRVFKNLNVSDGLKQLAVARRSEPLTSEWQKLSATFTTDEMTDTTECYVQLDCSWNDTEFPVVCNFKNIMISYGDNTEWEPYEEPQAITITSERPITKWDRLVQKDGVIGWEYKSGSITFDGSKDESWLLYGSTINTFAIDVSGLKFKDSFCYNYIHGNSSWASNKYGIYSDNGYATKYFRPPYEGFEISVDAWKGFLKENPLTVVCESSESEFVPLPTEEQETIKELKTYYPTTVFSNDDEMFMQVEYMTKYSRNVFYPENISVPNITINGMGLIAKVWGGSLDKKNGFSVIKLKPNKTYKSSCTIRILEKGNTDGFNNTFSTNKQILLYRQSGGDLPAVSSIITQLTGVESGYVENTFKTPEDLTDCIVYVYTERYTNSEGKAQSSTVAFENLYIEEV